MTSRRTPHRPGRFGGRVLAGFLVAAIVATAAHAKGPDGFVDGTWQGGMVWEARATFTDAVGSGKASGNFTATFTGGTAAGDFGFKAPNAIGDTPEAKAEVDIVLNGTFSGTSTEPVLVPTSGRLTGTVNVYSVGTFPVDISLGAGELVAMPLDITVPGCSMVTGTFTTHIAQVTDVVASAGGALTVQRAFWYANRVGEAGAAPDDQMAAIDQLLADAVEMAKAIDAGTFDANALRALLRRAEEFAAGLPRNAACGIGAPGNFSSAISGVVTDLLVRMVAHEELFDVQQFWSAILAGLQSGALGSNAGQVGAKLEVDLRNVLGSKFTAAVAGSNKQDLLTIHLAATTLGDKQLAAQALAEAEKL